GRSEAGTAVVGTAPGYLADAQQRGQRLLEAARVGGHGGGDAKCPGRFVDEPPRVGTRHPRVPATPPTDRFDELVGGQRLRRVDKELVDGARLGRVCLDRQDVDRAQRQTRGE